MPEFSPAILLPTYNGAKYLVEQIESLQNQTFRNWTLYCRDDGSSDRTLAILEHHASLDRRINIVTSPTPTRRIGQLPSLAALAERAFSNGHDIYFLCDQDDVWSAQKLETVLNRFTRMNAAPEDLVAVFHELQPVNSCLQPLAEDMKAYAGFMDRPKLRYRGLLLRNQVNGNALAFTRAVLDAALPFPPDIVAHDWWIALVSATCGQLVFEPHKLCLYRLHDTNSVGMRPMSYREGLQRMFSSDRASARAKHVLSAFGQIKILLNRFEGHLTPDVETYLRQLATVPDLPLGARLRACCKLKPRTGNRALDITLLWTICRLPLKSLALP